ncbi:hypothetical protein TVAG_315800 [Trichomonas vaginalis G3]|uniref:Dynamin N-terminal domain-containing protein n=1 Tax=Trichomonas vaginalis (strain ATCC PRA-98 / G3) TaxID=412133 RepID=A2FLN9_TRIV3|nr:GTPase, Dynamin_N and MMR_HSR1 domain-containing protein [Trichomonas vaginalis G3]EAX94174.1 hypothetical protein TVAG_315800 [Trichomonas vaginalis G3]KAI5540674.1 GTPase, Dynamin_N and MMR_HSR1 domain-containing protein [Trichomonas vaginalis G3]|eukprot:XP_001307104.1 hypothetical protein [Trichomonas vaginalis G3]
MGLHSTGKSSLINYFFGTPIQKVALSRATDKITIIKSGKETDTFTLSTFKQKLPFIEQCPLLNHHKYDVEIKTVNCTLPRTDSVIFIDTPGYSPETPIQTDYIVELARISDLIYVMIDPIQTFELKKFSSAIQQLYKQNHYKMKFFINKADTTHDISDLNLIASDKTNELIKIIPKSSEIADPVLHPIQANSPNIENPGDYQKPFIDPVREKVDIMVQNCIDKLEEDNSNISYKVETFLASAKRRRQLPLYTFSILLGLSVYVYLALTSDKVYYQFWLNYAFIASFVLFIISLLQMPKRKNISLATDYHRTIYGEIKDYIHAVRNDLIQNDSNE